MRHQIRLFRVALIATITMLSFPAAGFAQAERKHWGAAVSFAPKVRSSPWYNNIFIAETDDVFEVSEFSVGFVRGKTLGGDWGVSFVQKPFRDGTTLIEAEDVSDPMFFSRFTSTRVFQQVRMRGAEFHIFVPFVRFKNRIQIGITGGAGGAVVEGNILQTMENFTRITFPNGQVREESFSDSSTYPANEDLFPIQVLFKVEATGAVIVAPGLKVKVTGGLNSPGTGAIRIGVLYLIGAR